MQEITSVIKDILIIGFIIVLTVLVILSYLKLNKLFSKVDSLVDSSQKLWSLIGYIVSPIDKINSKSLEMIAKYFKSIDFEKATKKAKKATKSASEKIRRKKNE
tara:strand:+ start:692 stop:1003 length:312 start_codon:yes stop_codon:yes gene_type:complete